MPYKTENSHQLNDTWENVAYLQFYVNIGKYVGIGVASYGALCQFPLVLGHVQQFSISVYNHLFLANLKHLTI